MKNKGDKIFRTADEVFREYLPRQYAELLERRGIETTTDKDSFFKLLDSATKPLDEEES